MARGAAARRQAFSLAKASSSCAYRSGRRRAGRAAAGGSVRRPPRAPADTGHLVEVQVVEDDGVAPLQLWDQPVGAVGAKPSPVPGPITQGDGRGTAGGKGGGGLAMPVRDGSAHRAEPGLSGRDRRVRGRRVADGRSVRIEAEPPLEPVLPGCSRVRPFLLRCRRKTCHRPPGAGRHAVPAQGSARRRAGRSSDPPRRGPGSGRHAFRCTARHDRHPTAFVPRLSAACAHQLPGSGLPAPHDRDHAAAAQLARSEIRAWANPSLDPASPAAPPDAVRAGYDRAHPSP